jgi:hypothetical protein
MGFSGSSVAAMILALSVSVSTPKKSTAADPVQCVVIGGVVVCGAGAIGLLAWWLYSNTVSCTTDGSCPRTADGSTCAPNATCTVQGLTCKCIATARTPCACVPN